MSDIVKRIDDQWSKSGSPELWAEVDALRAALRPFAEVAKSHDAALVAALVESGADPADLKSYYPDNTVMLTDGALRSPVAVTLGDLRRAVTALSARRA